MRGCRWVPVTLGSAVLPAPCGGGAARPAVGADPTGAAGAPTRILPCDAAGHVVAVAA